MKLVELVREYIPEADDELALAILWNETAFPFADLEHIRLQLARYACREIFADFGYWDSERYLDWLGKEEKR